MRIKLIFIIFLAITDINSHAGADEFIFSKPNLIIFAPPIINKDYFLIEFGFISEKDIISWNYKYNAYAAVTLFQDSLDKKHLRAGALGFKGGVILPTQLWTPLFLTGALGFAKTALHKEPFFGREDSSTAQKDMIFLEIGALYKYDKYFFVLNYQRSNVKYFTKHTNLMFGVNY